MKKGASFIVILFMLACSIVKIDQPKARELVEHLLTDLKNGNYSSLDQYYSSSFNEGEPLNQKIEKFNRIKEAAGDIKSYELVSSKQIYDNYKGINQLELKYKVVCTRIPVVETFLVINDEGELKIIFQNIENNPVAK